MERTREEAYLEINSRLGTTNIWRFVYDACDATRLGNIKASSTPWDLAADHFDACQLPTSAATSS